MALLHPSMRMAQYDWAQALRAVREARGLSHGDVARLVGLGWPADRIADLEACSVPRDWAELLEVTEALGLSPRVELEPADEAAARWSDGTVDRERARRARR